MTCPQFLKFRAIIVGDISR